MSRILGLVRCPSILCYVLEYANFREVYPDEFFGVRNCRLCSRLVEGQSLRRSGICCQPYYNINLLV